MNEPSNFLISLATRMKATNNLGVYSHELERSELDDDTLREKNADLVVRDICLPKNVWDKFIAVTEGEGAEERIVLLISDYVNSPRPLNSNGPGRPRTAGIPKGEKSESVTVRFSVETIAQIKVLAEEAEKKSSVVIRDIVRQYISSKFIKAVRQPSNLEYSSVGKGSRITATFSSTEHSMLVRHAALNDKTVSRFVRDIVVAELEENESEYVRKTF